MASAPFDPFLDPFDGARRRRSRRRLPFWSGPALLGAIVAGILLLLLINGPTVGDKRRENKVINVVLPPPPPPPPPPPLKEKPPEPEKPKIVDQPQPTPDTPPPPTPQAPPAPGENALSARTGAGPSNYGLAVGNGGGTRIGGQPGISGAGFAAYGMAVASEIQRACSRDAAVASGRYAAQLVVRVASDGTISDAQLAQSSGDGQRARAIRSCVAGYHLSQRPPAGLRAVRVEFNSRPGL